MCVYNVCCTQVLYVLYFNRDSETVKASSVTEFLLTYPCLSLAVFDTKTSPIHNRHPDTAQIHSSLSEQLFLLNRKHLKNVGPIRHCEPPHAHSPGVASGTVARRDIDSNDDNDNA